jgi:hypothetical protein
MPIVKAGIFFRASDLTHQQRYLCRGCEKTFSTATLHPCYRQKKRQVNPAVFQLLCSGVSQRRLAKLQRLNRKTVVRKLIFLGAWAKFALSQEQQSLPKVSKMEFDDLETFEHSKLKPLSVVMAVETGSRRILGYKVAQMPAKGLLVHRSLQKYGRRKDERKAKRQELFENLQACVKEDALIRSDENPHYKPDVRRYFPKAQHEAFLGRRGCVVGQGELKAGGFDPLFTLNHTFAMFRANINRLFRRTWCTTKKKERLDLHIALYCLYHNRFLIPPSTA